MKIESYIPFLGDSPNNDRLDDQLEDDGLKGRPKGEDPTVFVKNSDGGFVLGFSSDAAYEEFYAAKPKTPGNYVLVSIYSEPQKADLPFGLAWGMALDDLKARLGEPSRVAATNATFFYEGLQLVCRFKDKSMKEMSSATVSLVDVYAKERYGL